MTVEELRDALDEHPLRRDYEVIIYSEVADITGELGLVSLDWDVSGKRIIINYG